MKTFFKYFIPSYFLLATFCVQVEAGIFQENSIVSSCEPAPKPSRWKVGGSIEAVYYTNSHGNEEWYDENGMQGGNGYPFSPGLRLTHPNISELRLHLKREMDARNGWDWGTHVEMVWGTNASLFQKWHDRSFDNDWGGSEYGLAFTDMKATLGYKNMTLTTGLFSLPIGYEGSAWHNFFTSSAFLDRAMPLNGIGFLVDYKISERISVSGGWIAGANNGRNRFHDSMFVGTVSTKTFENGRLNYSLITGSADDGQYSDGSWRYGNASHPGFQCDCDVYIHSLNHVWNFSKRWLWMVEWDYMRYAFKNSTRDYEDNWSLYGIHTQLTYQINDKWSLGGRFEWGHDNRHNFLSRDSDFHEISLALNWQPTQNIKIRPEIRYDWVQGNGRPFDLKSGPTQETGGKQTQFSGGIAVFYLF